MQICLLGTSVLRFQTNGSQGLTLTAHLRIECLHHGAPLTSCQICRPSNQCHIVEAETEAVAQQVLNKSNSDSEAGI